MRRRRLLTAACVHCAAASIWPAAKAADWAAPARFTKPDLSTDEGGLWAMMDREETRLRRSPFTLRDAGLRDYLQGITCKLAGDHCPDVRVYPVRVPFFNASMAPNGMMQIWTGLLLRVENEAQLAAVIGHEIGHYMQRHTLDRLRDLKARTAFMAVLAPFGLVGLIGQLATAAGAYGFSRDQERQADAIGIQLMTQAGYDPREAPKIWENLHEEASAAYGGDPTKNSPMFATHPPSDERKLNLTRLAGSSQGGFVGDAQLAERLKGLQGDLLEDEIKRGQHDETLVLLGRMIGKQAKRPDLHYFRGETRRLRAKDSDFDDALIDFNNAVQLGSEPPEVHRSKGYIYQQRGQTAEARLAFKTYLELAPNALDAGLIQQYLI